MRTERCRSCDAPIVWALTRNDRRMPVDRDPNEARGNVMLVDEKPGDPPRVIVLPPDQLRPLAPPPGARSGLYTSHFATCEFATRHRKAGAR